MQSVLALKLHEYLDGNYPSQMESNMQYLLEYLENMKTVLDGKY